MESGSWVVRAESCASGLFRKKILGGHVEQHQLSSSSLEGLCPVPCSGSQHQAFLPGIKQEILYSSCLATEYAFGVFLAGAALKYLPSIINDVKLVFDPVELR